MLLFDDAPVLEPLRPRDQVLPAVIRRGTTLRRRRRALVASPVAIAVLAISALVAGQGPSRLPQRIHTVGPAGPASPDGSSGRLTVPAPATGGDSSTSPVSDHRPGATTGRRPGPAPDVRREGPNSGSKTGAAGAPHPANCGPADNDNPHPGWPDCWPTYYGPTGNYHQQPMAQSGARGCVVHNVAGTGIASGGHPTNGGDGPTAFFCSYDALRAGGFTTTAPYVIVRIVRHGRTIDIDGRTGPRCEPTGYIQPGDHVYVDGRNFDVSKYGFSTLSAGDVFHC